jgi:hypothetical protein
MPQQYGPAQPQFGRGTGRGGRGGYGAPITDVTRGYHTWQWLRSGRLRSGQLWSGRAGRVPGQLGQRSVSCTFHRARVISAGGGMPGGFGRGGFTDFGQRPPPGAIDFSNDIVRDLEVHMSCIHVHYCCPIICPSLLGSRVPLFGGCSSRARRIASTRSTPQTSRSSSLISTTHPMYVYVCVCACDPSSCWHRAHLETGRPTPLPPLRSARPFHDHVCPCLRCEYAMLGCLCQRLIHRSGRLMGGAS